ncbi:MAG TPA: hypothetical protein PLM07_04040 [Candidatus Rifleibacterium sp.]|nr:hypothetical protein [Candidatus Rifleibacterium sp.]HPT45056.1 hypothetical protein [Candidatus Rifleibacterium sp.]
MKKLLLIVCLVAASGCSNPISSAVDKEGEETRIQMQTELATAKNEINAELQRQLETMYVNISGQLVSVMQFLYPGNR